MVNRNDVAKRAGVSSATVSRVMNNSDKVNPVLRQEVLKAVEELGYKPNAAAKSLRAQKSYNIAYIIPDITNPYYTENYKGINEYASSKGYICHLIEAAYPKWRDNLINQKFDGIIYGMDLDEDQEVLEERLDIPMVVQSINPKNISKSKNCIYISHDIYTVLMQAFSHMYSKGHRKIGIVTRRSKNNIRLKAYVDSLKKFSLSYNEKLIVEYDDVNYHYQTGFKCMEQLITRNTGITAVFAQNDLIAIGAMSSAVKKGLKIPEDICFIGCDDTVAAKFSNPPLTTIKLYKHKQGVMSAQILIDMINGKDVESYSFSAELVIRESV